MKKYDVKMSDQADYDLREIFTYIAENLESPENAAGQLFRIEERILKWNIFRAVSVPMRRSRGEAGDCVQ